MQAECFTRAPRRSGGAPQSDMNNDAALKKGERPKTRPKLSQQRSEKGDANLFLDARSTIPTSGMRRRGLCDFGEQRFGTAPRGSSRRQPGAAPQTRGVCRRPSGPFLSMPLPPVHARLSAELAAGGTAISSHNLIIAATALAKGYIVTTRDERSFPRIPGLAYQRDRLIRLLCLTPLVFGRSAHPSVSENHFERREVLSRKTHGK